MDNVSIPELANVVRQQRDYKTRLHDLRQRLKGLTAACGLQNHAIISRSNTQNFLAECIRTGNKSDFRTSFDALRGLNQAIADLIKDSRRIGGGDTDVVHDAGSKNYFQCISKSSQSSILDFLSDIVVNKEFFVSRLAALDESQLAALCVPRTELHNNLSRDPSIVNRSPSSITGSGSPLVKNFDAALEHTPLSLLLNISGFHHSAKSTLNSSSAVELWSDICARLLTENKTGCEKFVLSVVDAMTFETTSTGKRALETWFKEALRDGQFLLPKSDYARQMSMRQSTQAQYMEQVSKFYANASRKLIALLKNNAQTKIIPSTTLELCQAIVDKLSNAGEAKSRSGCFFFLAQWLFSKFLPDHIITPESKSYMLDDFFSETSRARILRESIVTAQKLVIDVTYSRKTRDVIEPARRSDIEGLAALFKPATNGSIRLMPSPGQSSTTTVPVRQSFTLSRHDIITLIDAIFPVDKTLRKIDSSSKKNLDTSRPESLHRAYQEIAQLGHGKNPVSTSEWTLMQVIDSRVVASGLDSDSMDETSGISSLEDLTDMSKSTHFETDYTNIRQVCLQVLSRIIPQDNPFGPITPAPGRSRSTVNNNPFRNNNPYRQSLSREGGIHNIAWALEAVDSNVSRTEMPSSLLHLLEIGVKSAEESEDYSLALIYGRITGKVRSMCLNDPHSQTSLVRCFINDVRIALNNEIRASKELEQLLQSLERRTLELQPILQSIIASANKSRVKLWYCSDVRNAAPFADLNKIAVAIQSLTSKTTVVNPRVETPVLRHKGALKSKAVESMKGSDASILEILVTDPKYRLSNKLTDEQVEIVQTWMQSSSIENLCSGEETIHRVLCEIAKFLNRTISSDPMISPVLWGSELFYKDRLEGEHEAWQLEIDQNDSRESLGFYSSRPSSTTTEFLYGDFQSRHGRTSETMIAAFPGPKTPSPSIDMRSQTPIARPSSNMWSPISGRPQSPYSNISSPSRAWSPLLLRQTMSRETFPATNKVRNLLTELKQQVMGLVISDVLYDTMPNGSETDRLLSQMSDNKSSQDISQSVSVLSLDSSSVLDINAAKRRLVQRFELTANPFAKLKLLYAIEKLILSADMEEAHGKDVDTPKIDVLNTRLETSLLMGRSGGELRRSVTMFQALFHDVNTRPRNLFRDFQTIASMIPTQILDDTAPGRAFWAASIAVISLKQEMSQSFVQAANTIIAVNAPALNSPRTSQVLASFATITQFDDPTNENPFLEVFRLLGSAAVQSHPAAQRELATLYLTQPDVIPRILYPFARCQVVFDSDPKINTTRPSIEVNVKTVTSGSNNDAKKSGSGKSAKAKVMSEGRRNVLEKDKSDRRTSVLVGGSEGNGNSRIDKETICVALHWMELAAKGGDVLAKEFLNAQT